MNWWGVAAGAFVVHFLVIIGGKWCEKWLTWELYWKAVSVFNSSIDNGNPLEEENVLFWPLQLNEWMILSRWDKKNQTMNDFWELLLMHGLKPMHLDSKSEWTGYCKWCMFFFFFWPVKISLYCTDWSIFAGRRGFTPRNENEKLNL